MSPSSFFRTVLIGAWLACFGLRPAAVGAQDYIEEEALFREDGLNGPARPIADPLKGFNKKIFRFNDHVYVKVLKPMSRGYENVMPRPARRGIRNFFSNLQYPVRLAGSLLQFKFGRAGRETGRFLINTTVGLGGFLNPAKKIEGLNPPAEDVGQALGRWGIGHGFYVVLPLLGSTSLRDGIGGLGDRAVHPLSTPYSRVDDTATRIGIQALGGVNNAPGAISVYESMMDSAVDPYEAFKDAYTQTRAAQVEQ